MRARFLPGQIVIPAFVVEELHRVADSADPEKRQRGRRGLDLVEEMKSVGEQRVQVLIEMLGELRAVSVLAANVGPA